jgi:hypothetical protein
LLRSVRNLLVYTFLGFGIQRSQSAVIPNTKSFQNPDRILTCSKVRYDPARYAVWWGLTHSKGDPFGKRKGRDGIDWTVTAGCRNASHPIDPVKLYQLYCVLMGFSTDPSSQLSRKQKNLPFFQELSRNGKATGTPLKYNTLLSELKRDISLHFPDIDPKDIGTHSFRRFGATYAKTKGIPNDLIQLMGRWVSDCFQRYFMFSDSDKADMSRYLVS